jgi:hypothetical protein
LLAKTNTLILRIGLIINLEVFQHFVRFTSEI